MIHLFLELHIKILSRVTFKSIFCLLWTNSSSLLVFFPYFWMWNLKTVQFSPTFITYMQVTTHLQNFEVWYAEYIIPDMCFLLSIHTVETKTPKPLARLFFVAVSFKATPSQAVKISTKYFIKNKTHNINRLLMQKRLCIHISNQS